jgi:hypothetical protein
MTPWGPNRKAELKSSLLPRASQQPLSIEVHSASSTVSVKGVPSTGSGGDIFQTPNVACSLSRASDPAHFRSDNNSAGALDFKRLRFVLLSI